LKNLFDEQNIKTKIDVYGNIPYNITSPILEWLLYESYNKWRFAVFMVQRDFANRLIAKEGENDYSALTVFSNFLSDIKLEFHVSKSVFFPKPNVDSSVISLSPKNVDMSIVDTYKLISKTIFHNRRKTLRNNLLNSPYIKIEAEKIDTIFDTLSIPAKERGENIPISTITDIVRIIENKYDVI
jgi:16S rRNA (adenine1518-N6/adenine1519-N6)-dimethyltransferase